MQKNLKWRLVFIVLIGLVAAWCFYPLQRMLVVDWQDVTYRVTPDGLGKPVDTSTAKITYRHPLHFSFFRIDRDVQYWCDGCKGYVDAPDGPYSRCAKCKGGLVTPSKEEPGVDLVTVKEKVYARSTLTPGLDLEGGSQLLYRINTDAVKTDQSAADVAERTVDIIRMRVDAHGMKEPRINLRGKSELLVQIPGASPAEVERVKDVIRRSGNLVFRLVEDDAEKLKEALALARKGQKPDAATLMEVRVRRGRLPTEHVVQRGQTLAAIAREHYSDESGTAVIFDANRERLDSPDKPLVPGTKLRIPKQKLLVSDNIEVEGTHIRRASEQIQRGWRVVLDFDRQGKYRFARVTGENVNKRLAIVLDGVLYSAPVIRQRIYGSAEISGDFTRDEARDLATILQAGSLDVTLELESEETVGPSLGEDAVANGRQAVIIASIVVLAFVAIYYLFAGLVADFALFYNLVLIMGVLALFNATLTLPGIAGLVLTMGMAIDANILIFERIREEKQRGAGLVMSIRNGYDRAFVTIVDANLTTLITALILYWVGTGPVRGFAVTLSAGILMSMFASLYATRAVLEFLATKGIIKNLPMLQIVSNPAFAFIRKRKGALALSAVLILAGACIFGMRSAGGKVLATDFTGGVELRVKFPEARGRPGVTAAVQKAVTDCEVQSVGTAAEGKADHFRSFLVRMPSRARAETVGEDPRQAAILKALGVQTFESVSEIGSVVASRMKLRAVLAIAAAMACIVLYIWLRFEFRFGIAAIAALAHDIVLTLGALALFDYLGLVDGRISLPTVAAILTIIGYSLNDTIVVFDRIRENLRKRRKEDYLEVVNTSINQTLGRTLLTSVTTLFAVVVLFFVGARQGGVLEGFAFALMIGVLAGTYSSVFIASPVLVAWHLRDERKRAAAAQR